MCCFMVKSVSGEDFRQERCLHAVSYTHLPPGCGKTTLLRDMTRALSLRGIKVAVCDERSEIAGMYDSVPSFDLGPRTDVLDGCDKTRGIAMLIRSMSPQVIVTDEMGRQEDIDAVYMLSLIHI